MLQKRVLKLRYDQLRMNELLKENTFPGLPVHLAIGHEVLAVGLAKIKGDNDVVCLSHRNFAYNLALGCRFGQVCDVFRASISATNTTAFGSMNFFDPTVGSVYSSSILANNLPVAAGVALSMTQEPSDRSVVYAITGDGAIEEGAFWETLIFSRSAKLPLIIIVENNNFSLGFFVGKRSKNRTADILYFDNHAVSPVDTNNRLYTLQYFNENLRIRRSDFALGSFDYSHQFENDSKLSATLLYEYTLLGGPTTNRNLGFPDTSELLQEEYNTNDNPLRGTLFRVDYEVPNLIIGNLEVGYQYRFLDHQGDFFYGRRTDSNAFFTPVLEFSSEIDLKRTLHSGYINLNGKQKNWEYIAGLRLEHMARELQLQSRELDAEKETLPFDYLKLFPSATIQYNLKKNVAVKVSYTKRVQRTTTFKMNPFAEREHSETLEQGDKNLRPEFLDLIEVGYAKRFKKGNSVYANAYVRYNQNLVNRVNTVFNDSILNRIYSNVGKARTIGLDVGANLRPTQKWTNFIGINAFKYTIDGIFNYENNGVTVRENIDTNAYQYSVNINTTYAFSKTSSLQFTLNYLSDRNTAQGEDSRFYQPNLTFRKAFLNNQLVATLQWQNMDLGLLNTNEQRITTARPNEFFTTTNYVYEVDMFVVNLAYNFTANKSKARFIKSEFGAKEF